jgi:hypothetical protein
LRNGTAGTIETDLGDPVAIEAEVNAALVTARGIVAVCNAVGGGQFSTIPRAAVVVENDGLVKVGKVVLLPEVREGQKLRAADGLANRLSLAAMTLSNRRSE